MCVLHWKGTALIQDKLEAFLADLQSAFMAGNLVSLQRYFQIPLVVYSAAGVTVLRDKAEFEKMTQDYMTALGTLSIAQARQTILSRDPVVNNRQRVTVRNVDSNEAGESVTSSTIRYFLVLGEQGYSVEMLEYLEAPLPISDVEKIVH